MLLLHARVLRRYREFRLVVLEQRPQAGEVVGIHQPDRRIMHVLCVAAGQVSCPGEIKYDLAAV